ncbi:hypothetical protein LVJ94_19155 [Pendulispora rubella]|uniref:Uncharacterized protein n=1 Tax=Pendulispora rubella TaxID=2741070 RepID=A0ABZ2LEH4_9BACT
MQRRVYRSKTAARALLAWIPLLLVGAGAGAGASMAGCSDDALKAPRSDTQYDDPDDPGTGGVVGAADATTRDAPFDAVGSGGDDAGADAHDASDGREGGG